MGEDLAEHNPRERMAAMDLKENLKDKLKKKILRKVIVAAVPVVAVAVVGGVAAAVLHLRQKRRKEASSFLSAEVRNALQTLCSLKGEDFIPDSLGTSLYQRKLDSLTDGQLIGVYVVIKLVEVLRGRGVDFRNLSKDNLAGEVLSLRDATHSFGNRRDRLLWLGSFGADAIRSLLGDAVLLASMAAQGA